jgi:hypothetical protein
MALPSSPSPCPLGSDFQVESIFKSAWKFRSGPIVSRTCWEAPHRSLSKAFKMNLRPRDGDLNLRDSRFHFTGLEIPRNKRKENEADKKQQNCSLPPIGPASVQGNNHVTLTIRHTFFYICYPSYSLNNLKCLLPDCISRYDCIWEWTWTFLNLQKLW